MITERNIFYHVTDNDYLLELFMLPFYCDV
jgi:hypothetical protein